MGNLNITFDEWRNNLRRNMEAAEQEKQAAALKAKDPADNGELGVPSYNTEAVRSNLNLPKNPTENTVLDKDGTHGLCTVTKPNAVGEGEYPTAIDGDARDAAFKTPSTPLSKIAEDQSAAEEELKPQEQPVQDDADKQAAVKDSFELPAELKSDASIMQKLAFCGNIILGDERGQRLVTEILTKEAGRIEALNILNSVLEDLEKLAASAKGVLDILRGAGTKALDWAQKNPGKATAVTAGGRLALGGDAAGANALTNDGEPGTIDAIKNLAGQAGDWLQGSTPIPGTDVQVPNWAIASLAGAGAGGLGYAGYKALSGGQDKSASIQKEAGNGAATAAKVGLGALLGAGGTLGAQQLNKAAENQGDKLTPEQSILDKVKGTAAGAWDSAKAMAGQAGDWLQGSTPIPGTDVQVPNWAIASLAGAGAGGLGYAGYNALSGNDEQPDQQMEVNASYEAMCKDAHAAWLNTLETDIEKAAYMQGATDAAAAAQAAQDPEAAAAMGGEIPADDSQLTDEEVMGVLQEMVQAGEISPEQVDALIQQVTQDLAPSYTAEQLAQMLAEDVQSGAIPKEVAEQIAQEILAGMESGAIPSEGAAADPTQAPTGADQAMEVQASLNRTLDILNNLG